MKLFSRSRGVRLLAGIITVMLWALAARHLVAQPADDCAALARRCCASLTIPMRDSTAYRVVYDVHVRMRGKRDGERPSPLHASVECMATHDFIWSRGDSIDVLRTKEETLTVDKKRRVIYRSDARMSEGEIDARLALTSFLQDTLFDLVEPRACIDSAADVSLRVVTLAPKSAGRLGPLASIVIVADPGSTSVRSITLNQLGSRDGVLSRQIVFREPPRLIPWRAAGNRPMLIDVATGAPAPEYRGFTIVDLRHRVRN